MSSAKRRLSTIKVCRGLWLLVFLQVLFFSVELWGHAAMPHSEPTAKTLGHFGFAIQVASPAEGPRPRQIPRWPGSLRSWYLPVVRWIQMGALTLWLGGIGFLVFIVRPLLAVRSEVREQILSSRIIRNSGRIVSTSAALFLTTTTVWFFGHTRVPLLHPLSWGPLPGIIWTTDVGQLSAVQILCAIGLWIVSARLVRPGFLEKRWGKGQMFYFALLGLMILVGLGSMAHRMGDAGKGEVLPIAVDWVHLVVTAIWVGGLCHFLMALAVSRKQDPAPLGFISELTARFSTIALYSVLLVIATGIYGSWVHIPTWSSFLSLRYGQVLAVKIGLFLGTLLIGVVNRQRAVPALAAFPSAPENAIHWSARLRKLVWAEVILGALILGAVGVLATLPSGVRAAQATRTAAGRVP